MELGWDGGADDRPDPVTRLQFGVLRLLEQHQRDGTEAVEEGDIVVMDRAPEVAGREAREQHERDPGDEADHHVPGGVHVEPRRHHQVHVSPSVSNPRLGRRVATQAEPVLVGQHATLGEPGGARGVLQGDQVAGAQIRQRPVGRGRRDQRVEAETPVGDTGAAADYHPFQGGAGRLDPPHQAGPLRVGDDQPGAGVPQDVGEIRLLIGGVAGHDHRAQARHREPGQGEQETVRQHDGHPVLPG